MSAVKFGELPPKKNRVHTPDYDRIEQALRLEPGEWAQIAVVSNHRDLSRWLSALRSRKLRVAQRRSGPGMWTIWGMAPDDD